MNIFKPHATAYELVEKTLGVKPEDTLFVSSNAFDACAAKNFGFHVAWIERVTQVALAQEVAAADVVGPGVMFQVAAYANGEFWYGSRLSIAVVDRSDEIYKHLASTRFVRFSF